MSRFVWRALRFNICISVTAWYRKAWRSDRHAVVLTANPSTTQNTSTPKSPNAAIFPAAPARTTAPPNPSPEYHAVISLCNKQYRASARYAGRIPSLSHRHSCGALFSARYEHRLSSPPSTRAFPSHLRDRGFFLFNHFRPFCNSKRSCNSFCPWRLRTFRTSTWVVAPLDRTKIAASSLTPAESNSCKISLHPL